MTKTGKCDCCRERKVKCDEIRPRCGPCKKVGRECLYTYGQVSKFVNYHQDQDAPSSSSSRGASGGSSSKDRRHKSKNHEVMLNLRSSKNMQSGNMQTFNLVPINRTAATENYTGSEGNEDTQSLNNSSLLPIWSAYLQNEGHETSLYCLGDWIDVVQQYVDRHEVVDAAVMAVLAGSTAFSSGQVDEFQNAREVNIQALQLLRFSLDKDSQDSRPALVATKLLYIAEILINPGSYDFQYHVSGLMNILRGMQAQNHRCDETTQAIYYGNFYSETTSAMFRGDKSTFERTPWAEMPAPDHGTESRWPGYTTVLRTMMQTYIQLARLVYVTRKFQQRPNDAGRRSEAMALASRLAGNFGNAEGWINQLLQAGVVITTVPSADDSLVTHSVNFASPRLFQLAITIWTGHIILAGCIQRLAQLSRLPSSLDLAAVQQAEVQCAQSIAMCVNYGRSIDASGLPCAQITIMSPLRTAYGAWYRLGQREMGGSAEAMMVWCLDALHGMEGSLSLRFSPQDDLVRRMECLSGGPVYGTVSEV